MNWRMVSKWRKHDLQHIPFEGSYVIQHKVYGINDEVYMEACLQNSIFENCTTKNYLFELENEVL